MNTVSSIASELEAIRLMPQTETVQIIARGKQVIKARVYLDSDLFIQIYRNDRFQTTNFALILSDRRIYGRDERGGRWHRHTAENPEAHDESENARQAKSLLEFWEEALFVISNMDGLVD